MDEPVTELIASIKPMVAAAFEAVADEPLTWDVSWVVAQTDKGPAPVILCYVHVKTHQIGMVRQAWFIIPVVASEQQIKAVVAREVQALKAKRDKDLHDASSQLNSTGKLILPS